MLWFAPRSYLRWVGAAALVGLSWWIQLAPSPLTVHPFATEEIAAGTDLSQDMFEWREIPEGTLEPVAVQGSARVAIRVGDPLLPSLVATARARVPEGWWAVELATPTGLLPGQHLLLVAGGDGFSGAQQPIPGLVVRPSKGGYDSGEKALIAVPGEHLATISQASGYGTLTIAVALQR